MDALTGKHVSILMLCPVEIKYFTCPDTVYRGARFTINKNAYIRHDKPGQKENLNQKLRTEKQEDIEITTLFGFKI